MNAASVVELEDTIVAIGSSHMHASRGVVRLSGPKVITIATSLGVNTGHGKSARFVDAEIDLGQPLGKVPARVLVWPTRRSYTGQPSMEIHCIGSLPILSAIVTATTDHGARAARPGEFTLRAFLAGRMDLTQAEAVLGVIDAEGRGALDHALRQLSGNLSKPIEHLRSQLLDLLADVEAGLDFVDEDIQFISDDDLSERLTVIANQVESTLKQLSVRSRQKAEWVVALRGLPNAGKSRLLNELAGKQAAIVADLAGTTRDVVAVPVEFDRIGAILVDTAGIESVDERSAEHQIAFQAQFQAERAGREADVRLWCVDRTSADWDQTVATMRDQSKHKRRSAIDLWVATKCDLAKTSPLPAPWIATSCETGFGIDHLRAEIANALTQLHGTDSGSVASTASRCVGSLRTALAAIEAAISYVRNADGHEYVSSELRLAAGALGEVTGAVYTDDILDRVFSRFCIGK